VGASEIIRPYVDADERGWVERRVLAFLDTAYFDAVEWEKEPYERPSVELVAEVDGRIVGLIDVECEEEPAPCAREQIFAYLHVYPHGRSEMEGVFTSELPVLKPVKVFAHYTGDRREEIRERFERVHDCVCYERRFP